MERHEEDSETERSSVSKLVVPALAVVAALTISWVLFTGLVLLGVVAGE